MCTGSWARKYTYIRSDKKGFRELTLQTFFRMFSIGTEGPELWLSRDVLIERKFDEANQSIAKYPVQCAVSAQVFATTWRCSLGRGGHESCESWQQFQVPRPTTNRVFFCHGIFIIFKYVHDVLYFVIWWSGEELRREAISVAVEGFGA